MWALGILTYEMIMGVTPFYHENRVAMFDAIVNAPPRFPPNLDHRITDFISKLLTKDQSERPTFQDMQSHPFFEGFNWDTVIRRGYRPKFVPETTGVLDASNFDPEFTSEPAADSFVPAVPDIAHVPGFSYSNDHISQSLAD
jgi:serine/threonine protein kinase